MNDGTPNLPVWADGLSGKNCHGNWCWQRPGTRLPSRYRRWRQGNWRVAGRFSHTSTMRATNGDLDHGCQQSGNIGKNRVPDRLDVLVNNAGTNQLQSFLDVTEDALDTMLTLNVRTAFVVAQRLPE